jgi:hypothetical protein
LIPIAESMRESNQKTPECGIPNRKKIASATNLSCKNDYFAAPANPNKSTNHAFFTDDALPRHDRGARHRSGLQIGDGAHAR